LKFAIFWNFELSPERRTNTLDDLFVAPDSVEQIRALAAQGGRSPVAEMFARQLLQTPQELQQ
jgi:hypothetical protein